MSGQPFFSVIVPVYNVAEYLPKCIDSILAQTNSHFEIILVDDGSVDESGKICDEYAKKDCRIKVIHKVNGGLSDARNAGIEVARGEYITFVDSDDVVNIAFLDVFYSLIKGNNADIASVEFKSFYDDSELDLSHCRDGKIIRMSAERAIEKSLYQNQFDSSVCNKAYRRDVIGDLRFPVGKLYEDLAFNYKLFERAKSIVHKQVPLYCYRLRKESITGNFSLRRVDVLDITDEIVAHMAKHYHRLLPAALDRKFAANMNILWLMTRSDVFDEGVEIRCWKNIKALRFTTLCNPKSRLKNRAGALIAMFGKQFVKFVFSHIKHSR